MSLTPLSDLMAVFHQTHADKDFHALLELFKTMQVGVLVLGVEQTDVDRTVVAQGAGIGLANTGYGDGQNRLLAFADPREFNRRFGPKCNADMAGSVLFATALHNPDCCGILLNSALSEISVVIPREAIVALVSMGQGKTDQPGRKWWQFWR